MKVAEVFYSIQGEGSLVGVPSAFVRTSGCNLRCHFCDSAFTSWEPQGEHLTVAEILKQVSAFKVRHVVITGGEPLIAGGIEDLCSGLRAAGHHITIETAATVFKPVACDLASLSPKLSSSTPWQRADGRFALRHEGLRLRVGVVRAFLEHSDCQLKFVIDRPEDVAEVLDLLEQLPKVDPATVLLMPQGVTPEEVRGRGLWVVEECKKHGFRYCPRIHIDLFGHRRGT